MTSHCFLDKRNQKHGHCRCIWIPNVDINMDTSENKRFAGNYGDADGRSGVWPCGMMIRKPRRKVTYRTTTFMSGIG